VLHAGGVRVELIIGIKHVAGIKRVVAGKHECVVRYQRLRQRVIVGSQHRRLR